jgi:hypothetical protein
MSCSCGARIERASSAPAHNTLLCYGAVTGQRRVQATIEKTRRGALPVAPEESAAHSIGDGATVRWLRRDIHPAELLFSVSAVEGRLRFHDVCFHAWKRAWSGFR